MFSESRKHKMIKDLAISGVIATGPFLDLILPFFIGLLQKCLEPKPVPEPQPAESAATAESWKWANDAQNTAESRFSTRRNEYDNAIVSRGAGELMRQHRHHDGSRITRKQAVAYTIENLNALRTDDLEDIAVSKDNIVNNS